MSDGTAAAPSPEALDLLSGLLQDAVSLTARGVARRADVDTAMRLGAGHPWGPFAVIGGLPPGERHRLRLPDPADADEPPAAEAGTGPGWHGPIGVVGTGHMACGIVEVVARSDRPVRVLARSTASGEALLTRLAAALDRTVARGRLDEAGRTGALDRVRITTEYADLAGVDVVVEAVAEDLGIKMHVIARLDDALPAATPIATNTSSFRVADVRPSVAADRPVIGLHFFNPAPAMKLLEVVVPDSLPDAPGLRAAATAWARDLGKTPVACADTRGFIVNRLLIPYLNDAVRLHDAGTPVGEIDELMRSGAGHPMGPLALVDLIGVDVTIAALESMAAVEDDDRIRPAAGLLRLAEAGRLGRKTGAGFYPY